MKIIWKIPMLFMLENGKFFSRTSDLFQGLDNLEQNGSDGIWLSYIPSINISNMYINETFSGLFKIFGPCENLTAISEISSYFEMITYYGVERKLNPKYLDFVALLVCGRHIFLVDIL